MDIDRLNKLKQFIIDKYDEEHKNPVITMRFRIEVPITTINEIFNVDFKVAFTQFSEWVRKEFPTKSVKVYLDDRLHTDVYVEIN